MIKDKLERNDMVGQLGNDEADEAREQACEVRSDRRARGEEAARDRQSLKARLQKHCIEHGTSKF